MDTRSWATVGAFVFVAAVSNSLLAQDAATAATLFDRGLADMLAGKFTTACPSLAESYRLDPQPGALFTLAECEAKAGRFATAVARYDEYLEIFSRMPPKDKANQKGREKTATSAKATLMPKVPMVTLKLPASAPEGTRVKRDGILLNGPALGVPIPVDPGQHVITTQVPDGPAHEQRFTIEPGAKKDVELEIELPSPAEPKAAPPASASAPVKNEPQPPAPAPVPWLTYTAFGVGGLGIVVGTVTGAMSWSKTSSIKESCDGSICPTSKSSDVDSAKTLATVSNVSFAIGLVGVGVGVYSLLTAPPKSAEKSPAPMVRLEPVVGPGYAGLNGSF